MNLMDLLNWISRNGVAAFIMGCFIIAAISWLVHLIVNIVRSITGKYPPPRPVVECPCSESCDYHEDEEDETY